MRTISHIGHDAMNAMRALSQAVTRVATDFWERITIRKKPAGEPTVASRSVAADPVVSIRSHLSDRTLDKVIIDEYGGLNKAEEDTVNATKEQLLEALETKRIVGGGDDFSDELIDTIKQQASDKARDRIDAKVKSGNKPTHAVVVSILGEALFETMLELPQNQGLTAYQQKAAWAAFNEAVALNQQKKALNPRLPIPELMAIPCMQDYINEHNVSALLDRAVYPIMRDVREAKEYERPAIQSGQNGMIAEYVAMISSIRREDTEGRIAIDAVLKPKLKEALLKEMNRTEDALEMTHEQFKALANLYREMVSAPSKESREDARFLAALNDHPRLQ
jgi:hypothetical protein